GGPEGGVETRAGGDAGPPAPALEISAGDRRCTGAGEVGGEDIDPVGGGAPGVPLGGSEGRAGGDGGPPRATFKVASGEIGFAVAVEIADFHIVPGGPCAPRVPKSGVEAGRAVGKTDPPSAALQIAPGNVRFAIAVEVAHLNIDPGGAHAPG